MKLILLNPSKHMSNFLFTGNLMGFHTLDFNLSQYTFRYFMAYSCVNKAQARILFIPQMYTKIVINKYK